NISGPTSVTSVALSSLPEVRLASSALNSRVSVVTLGELASYKEIKTYDTIVLKSLDLTEEERQILNAKGMLQCLVEAEQLADIKHLIEEMNSSKKMHFTSEEASRVFNARRNHAFYFRQINLKGQQLFGLLYLNKIDLITFHSFCIDNLKDKLFLDIKYAIYKNKSISTICKEDVFLLLEDELVGNQKQYLQKVSKWSKEMGSFSKTQTSGTLIFCISEEKVKALKKILAVKSNILTNLSERPQNTLNLLIHFYREMDRLTNYTSLHEEPKEVCKILLKLLNYYYQSISTSLAHLNFLYNDSKLQDAITAFASESITKDAANLGKKYEDTFKACNQFIKQYKELFNVWNRRVKILQHSAITTLGLIETLRKQFQKKLNEYSSSRPSQAALPLSALQSEEKGLRRDGAIEEVCEAFDAFQVADEDSVAQAENNPLAEGSAAEWVAVQCERKWRIKPPVLTIDTPTQRDLKVLYHKRVLDYFNQTMSSEDAAAKQDHNFALAVDQLAFKYGKREFVTCNQRQEMRLVLPAVITTRTGDKMLVAFTYTLVIDEKHREALLYHRCIMKSNQDFKKWYSKETIQYLKDGWSKIESPFVGKVEKTEEKGECNDGSWIEEQMKRKDETHLFIKNPQNDSTIKILA
ncbi:MAG: hypothetical protein JWO53_422, partial [Chlamydiia bacterium]|nr:hypothetical protein [Chlamydiia bacterium]